MLSSNTIWFALYPAGIVSPAGIKRLPISLSMSAMGIGAMINGSGGSCLSSAGPGAGSTLADAGAAPLLDDAGTGAFVDVDGSGAGRLSFAGRNALVTRCLIWSMNLPPHDTSARATTTTIATASAFITALGASCCETIVGPARPTGRFPRGDGNPEASLRCKYRTSHGRRPIRPWARHDPLST